MRVNSVYVCVRSSGEGTHHLYNGWSERAAEEVSGAAVSKQEVGGASAQSAAPAGTDPHMAAKNILSESETFGQCPKY